MKSIMWRNRPPYSNGGHVIDRDIPPYPMADAVESEVTPSVFDVYAKCHHECVMVGDVLLTDGRIMRGETQIARAFGGEV